jgi:adenine-specific DNA-methyltransferase
MPRKPPAGKTVDAISHSEDRRKNIPAAKYQSLVDDDTRVPKPYKYPRNTDLDPQLVWRGKVQPFLTRGTTARLAPPVPRHP